MKLFWFRVLHLLIANNVAKGDIKLKEVKNNYTLYVQILPFNLFTYNSWCLTLTIGSNPDEPRLPISDTFSISSYVSGGPDRLAQSEARARSRGASPSPRLGRRLQITPIAASANPISVGQPSALVRLNLARSMINRYLPSIEFTAPSTYQSSHRLEFKVCLNRLDSSFEALPLKQKVANQINGFFLFKAIVVHLLQSDCIALLCFVQKASKYHH